MPASSASAEESANSGPANHGSPPSGKAGDASWRAEPAAVAGDWDPNNPAAVQYPDGAWAVVYNDASNPVKLLFRRTLGGAEPQYWRDAVTVETGADAPAMVTLGGTTALFYRKAVGTVQQVFLRTSTDDGATWSAPTQLTSEAVSIYQIQASNVGGTIYMFWSRSDTSGVLQYRTSTNLASWSSPATVGQQIGPLQGNTFPFFDIKKLSSGTWALSWLNVSLIEHLPGSANNYDAPVIWFATSADLSSAAWSNKQELTMVMPFGQRMFRSMALAQEGAGTLYLIYYSQKWPWDDYVFVAASSDEGVTWTPSVIFGYEPGRDSDGSGAVFARNPYPVRDNAGTVRVFWDQAAQDMNNHTAYPGPYPAQLFRRDLPAGPITQISVSKEQVALCGPCIPTGAFVADPVNATTGNFTLPGTDFDIPARGPDLTFSRTYNSQRLVDGPLGFGWTHSYDLRLQTFSRGEVLIQDGTGRQDLYTPKAGGGYDPPSGHFTTLVHNPDETWTLTERDKQIKSFSAEGRLTRIEDRNGNHLDLGYDPEGKLISITSGSRALTLSYLGSRVSSITDPLGRTVSYSYNPAGDLTSVLDSRGKTWTYTYDPDHRMATKVDPNSYTVLTNTYTTLGRVRTQKDAKGGETKLNYGGSGGSTTVVDPRGNATAYAFDPSYRVTAVTDPYGKRIKYYYDPSDNLTRIEDQRKSPYNNTYFTYDDRGNVLTRKDGLNKVWSFTYNSFNDPLTETDPLTHTTTYTYNPAGNLTSVKNAKNETTTYTPDSIGQLTSVTDARNNTTTFGYDSYGNQTTITDPYDKTWTTTFDLASRKTKVTDPLGHETSLGYDAADNLTSITDGRGKISTFGYDNAGNRSSTTDPNNNVTSFAYDEKNRLVSVTDAANKLTSYTYDASDNLLTTKDANNHTSKTFTYDKNNLQLTEKDALNNTLPTSTTEPGTAPSAPTPRGR